LPSFWQVGFRTKSGFLQARVPIVTNAPAWHTAGPSGKKVTAAVKIAKLQPNLFLGNRFVGAYVWNPRESGVAVISLAITSIHLNPKTVTFANDSILPNGFGVKIVACGFQFDSD